MPQQPQIVKSPFGDRWYVVTRYRLKKGIDVESGESTQYLVASTKYDVTDQMERILKARKRVA